MLMTHDEYGQKEVAEEYVEKFKSNGWYVLISENEKALTAELEVLKSEMNAPKRGRPFKT